MSNHAHDLYDRQARAAGWRQAALGGDALTLVIAARGAVARYLSLAGACIGIESQVIVTPDLASGLDVAEASMAHNRRVFADLRRPEGLVGFLAGERVVTLVDRGDPAFDRFATDGHPLRQAGGAVAFAEKPHGIDFGLDFDAVAGERQAGPVVPRAEVLILVGELLTAVCSLAQAYSLPSGVDLAGPPRLARIPVPPPPGRPPGVTCRLYVGGLGGAISHQFLLAALGLDPVLREVFADPRSLLAGADDGQVEVSNRARQLGYAAAGGRKARETGRWIAGRLEPRARVLALDEPVSGRHFRDYGPFDAALSSLDSWGMEGRRLLADLCREHRVPALLSAGSSFTGGFTRLITADAACPYAHGKEQLIHRDDRRRSCAEAPLPSSLLPQLFLGGIAAATLRDHLLGEPVDRRGAEVSLLARGPEGLCWRPGSTVNLSCPCPGLGGAQLAGRAS